MPRSRCFHISMFAPRYPCMSRQRRFLVPKPVRAREARMQNWDDNRSFKDHGCFMSAPPVNGAISGELFFSINVDAGVQRQMI